MSNVPTPEPVVPAIPVEPLKIVEKTFFEKYGVVIAIAVVGFFLLKNQATPAPVAPVVPNTPVAPVVADKPSVVAMRQLMGKVEKDVCIKIAEYHVALATALKGVEPDTLQSEAFRAWLIESNSVYARSLNLANVAPGFGNARSAVFNDYLGLESRMFSRQDLDNAIAASQAVADACLEPIR